MSGSSFTNSTITRNPGDENLCYFKTPGSTLVLKSSVKIVDCATLLKMAVSNLMFLVFLCHELVLNGEVVSSLM